MSNPKSDSEDIILWPDDFWCYRYELDEFTHRSDDYEVIPVGTRRWLLLVD